MNAQERRELYCIVATREIEGDYVFHKLFNNEPSREELLKAIQDEDCGYNDDYGKFRYFKVLSGEYVRVPDVEELSSKLADYDYAQELSYDQEAAAIVAWLRKGEAKP